MSYNDAHGNITMIAAVDRNFAIGKDGKLPSWHLGDDMEWFKALTLHNTVIMGRKTYESLPDKYRPLPLRDNWILSRNSSINEPKCRTFRAVEDVLKAIGEYMVYVIGGGEIYRAFLPFATRLVITHVETEVDGADAFFPQLPGSNCWTDYTQQPVYRQEANEKNDFPFTIIDYRIPEHF